MNLARRLAPVAMLAPALLAVSVLSGCSSDSDSGSTTAASSSECVDATLPNATAEELVDVLKPQAAGEEDDAFRSLSAQFEQTRDSQIEAVKASAVFTSVPEGGDAGFAKAVCGQTRWDATTTPSGVEVASVRGQRGTVVATGHSACETFEQLQPSAASTDAWTDWAGYVEMMTQGDDTPDSKSIYDAAVANICPQFA